MTRRDWPQRIDKGHIYGNFRDADKAKVARKSLQQRREGNCEKHKAMIRQLVCCIPGCKHAPPNDPHHLKSGEARGQRGIGMKATDRFCVPLCRRHHDQLENLPSSQEIKWFQDMGLDDAHALADALWRAPRTVSAMTAIVMAHRQD